MKKQILSEELNRMKHLAGIISENVEDKTANVDVLKGVEFRMHPVNKNGEIDPSVYTVVKINDVSPLEAGASNSQIAKLKVSADSSKATQTQDNQDLIDANNYMAKRMGDFMIMVRDTMITTDYPNPNTYAVEKNSPIIAALKKAFGKDYKFQPKKSNSEFVSLFAN